MPLELHWGRGSELLLGPGQDSVLSEQVHHRHADSPALLQGSLPVLPATHTTPGGGGAGRGRLTLTKVHRGGR